MNDNGLKSEGVQRVALDPFWIAEVFVMRLEATTLRRAPTALKARRATREGHL